MGGLHGTGVDDIDVCHVFLSPTERLLDCAEAINTKSEIILTNLDQCGTILN